MSFKLPDLPYDYDALEPYIDTETMHIHHDKHHAGYVSNLNKILDSHKDLQKKKIEDLLENINKVPSTIQQSVINNAGGHANHSLFWEIMSPKGGKPPKGPLLDAIKSTFGSIDLIKEKFSDTGLKLFGSGWVFLIVDNGKLAIKRHSFQNSPLMHGKVPILGLDVWEHAYYLKYQNKRADYIKAWWNVVDWEEVGNSFLSSK